ncbi:MAG: VWA domain-containing protein [Erysipelothrix sp.]|jgi:uncharacterized protein YegL|nr:VWA domain-containing protein [Erysipelothrix sp.]
MKQDLTELIFILDKSGSMHGLEADTIGGFNSMLAKQKEQADECLITTVFFNHDYYLMHNRKDIKTVQDISEKEYQTEGMTALIDALGFTIHRVIKAQTSPDNTYHPNKVMVVIITDGEENSSEEYRLHQVKSMIEKQKKEHGWEFIFLGANIDAIETAEGFGIDANRAFDYHADQHGTALNFRMMQEVVTEFRDRGVVDESNLEEIRKYKKERENQD